MYSIRRRLLLVLVAGLSALIGASALFMEGSLREQATREFDAALIAEAHSLVYLTEQENGQVEFDYDARRMPQFDREEDPDHFQFWLDDGRVLMRSGRLGSDLPFAPGAAGEPRAGDFRLPDGRAGRIVRFTFVPKPPEQGDPEEEVDPTVPARTLQLAVARGRAPLDRVLARMRATIFGAGGAALALAVLLVFWAVAAGFRPIRSIARQVGRLDAEKLAARVELPSTPEELAPIVEQLNALLGRLRGSFERERRFTGNVAHELRTPLAELRSLAEVGARWPEDREAIVRFFRDVGDIASRMEGVLADLLLLARCQAGAEQVRRSRVDLKEAIEIAWSRLRPQAADNRVGFSLDLPRDTVVESDPGKLDIILSNVLGNAVSYARPGSEIRCSGGRNGENVDLEIANAAEPLGNGDLERLSEPFWRRDEARVSSRHAGLGLSVVEAVAALLRMRVAFAQDQDGTFRVRLVHPGSAEPKMVAGSSSA